MNSGEKQTEYREM